jgi:hypothetical protein
MTRRSIIAAAVLVVAGPTQAPAQIGNPTGIGSGRSGQRTVWSNSTWARW